MSERLQKVLARAGVASRRKAEDLITAGRVRVNGRTASLGQKVSEEDAIEVDGAVVARPQSVVTYLLNKPPGYVTTLEDEFGRPTVMDLVPGAPGLHPVGRLDLESEGLLLLTTDGELTLRLTHPRFEHEKEYRVWCAEGTLSEKDVVQLRQGVDLEDGPARALSAEAAESGCHLVLGEGRKRQVRRMLAALGYTVVRLVRTRVSGLDLGDLPSGQYRKLSSADVERLRYTKGGDVTTRNEGEG